MNNVPVSNGRKVRVWAHRLRGSFVRGFLGMGDKLFAIPWSSLKVDTVEHRFVLNVDKELLKAAPGFDKEHWPDMADRAWGAKVYTYYGAKPYWN